MYSIWSFHTIRECAKGNHHAEVNALDLWPGHFLRSKRAGDGATRPDDRLATPRSLPPTPCGLQFGTPSRAGDFVIAGQSAKVLPADRYLLHFRERDNFSGPTAGYHFKQLLVDGLVLWEEDVAGGVAGWRMVASPTSALASVNVSIDAGAGVFQSLWGGRLGCPSPSENPGFARSDDFVGHSEAVVKGALLRIGRHGFADQ